MACWSNPRLAKEAELGASFRVNDYEGRPAHPPPDFLMFIEIEQATTTLEQIVRRF
jgi:hypothetical protein